MHDIFNFYATIVKIPMGIHTIDLFTWFFRIYNAMMNCIHETFHLSFISTIYVQKSKYAKVKNNYAMLESKSG
jgi:hypothetical protein